MGFLFKYNAYLDLAEQHQGFSHYLKLCRPKQVVNSNLMDVDAALNELGMLSRVTDCRLRFLQEKNEERQKPLRQVSSLASVCVVKMNTDFISKVSMTKDIDPRPSVKTGRKWINSIKQTRKLARFCPYGGHSKYSRMSYPPLDIDEDSCDRSKSPVVSRQDSGNKSNPSSPVKSQGSLSSTGSSIVRSRSLDDLEVASLEDGFASSDKAEIDTVSLSISKLHVS